MKLSVLLYIVLCLGTLSARAQPVGVCTSLKNAATAQAAGCDYIEETVGGFLMPSKSDAEFEKALAQYRQSPLKIISCINFFPAEIKLTGDKHDHVAALAWAETAFRRAGEAGIRYIVLGSGNSRRLDEGYDYRQATDQFIALLKAMGPLAARYGVTVAIEHLNKGETNFFHTLAEGMRIVKKVNHPNIRCLCDIYHMARENEPPADIVKAGKYIVHVHVAENEDRAVPGVHNEDLRPYYDALHKIGYRGVISMECRWKDFSAELPVGVGTIRTQWKNGRQ